MWQRRGNKQPSISAPSQFTELDRDDGYYDDRYLETIHEVDSISSRRQSAHYGLPELPFRAVPPMPDVVQPEIAQIEIPQPVNVHPQQSPTTPTAPSRNHGLRIKVPVQDKAHADEISPLTPQNLQHRRDDDGQPISPIEQVAPLQARAPLPERTNQSQIPRKVSRPQGEDHQAPNKRNEYSGEPMSDEAGKASSVRPGSQPVEVQYPHLKERTRQILAGLRERDAAKSLPWGKRPPPVAADPLDDPPQREPWKGASGRAAIVAPVRNTPSARTEPLRAAYPERQKDQHPTIHDTVTTPQTQIHTMPARKPLRASLSEESIKPVVPLKTRNLTPDLEKVSPTQSPVHQTPTQESPVPSPELPYMPPVHSPQPPRHRVESPQYDEEPTTPTTPVPIPESVGDKWPNTPPSIVPPGIDREQSHFSWTTYTTSAADSPRSLAHVVRGSSPTPLPDLPAPIQIKKRPVSGSPFIPSSPYMYSRYADSNGSLVRKPLPGGGLRNVSTASNATSRAMATAKSLPPTPTIVEAADKIESLQAHLEALERQKHNISRIIADLQTALRKNAVVYDMWKRKEVEKNITNHKNSLDDIGREIHELSLQLHRAQRKRDEQAGVEASGLWIKRVTN